MPNRELTHQLKNSNLTHQKGECTQCFKTKDNNDEDLWVTFSNIKKLKNIIVLIKPIYCVVWINQYLEKNDKLKKFPLRKKNWFIRNLCEQVFSVLNESKKNELLLWRGSVTCH